MSLPIVSVCMITYNQDPYLEEAILGVLKQETNFNVELIIVNDASADNTEKIVKRLIESHAKGNWIKYFKHEENIGMMPNFEYALNQCSGQFVATCEGDDYWTDPFKLQKQVDFLECNPDFVICYHPVNVLFPDGKMEEDYLVKCLIQKEESNIYDLAVLGNFMHTPSVVFRNILKLYPESFIKSPIGDYFLWMLLAQSGKIKKLPDVMAVYRLGVGVLSNLSHDEERVKLIITLNLLLEHIGDETILEIINLRIQKLKMISLPYSIRSLNNINVFNKPKTLVNHISFYNLIFAVLFKFKIVFSRVFINNNLKIYD